MGSSCTGSIPVWCHKFYYEFVCYANPICSNVHGSEHLMCSTQLNTEVFKPYVRKVGILILWLPNMFKCPVNTDVFNSLVFNLTEYRGVQTWPWTPTCVQPYSEYTSVQFLRLCVLVWTHEHSSCIRKLLHRSVQEKAFKLEHSVCSKLNTYVFKTIEHMSHSCIH